jgi:UDP-N-acetylglucosamine--N-acetylmuramyl-(pentapeptide) pyrophosphoryl-undecaprenol N-acetylglucosamine transferase
MGLFDFMKIIITGGGTGGHIYPGISLAKTFQKRDKNSEIIFIGAEQKMESEIIPQEGFPFLGLRVRGLKRKVGLENIFTLWLFFSSLATSYRIIKEFKPDLVIGTGGYVSGSVALVSSLMGIPTFIHEQNVTPGLTNKFLSLTSRKVFTSFPESKKYFPRKNRIECLGNPVRENIWFGDRNKLIKRTSLVDQKRTILVFGGSKGASIINQTFLECLDLIDGSLWKEWQVLIISGKEDSNDLKRKVNNSKYKEIIYITSYLYHIEDAYALADLVICRAGATTIAELTAKGMAAILIPYPYATGNHQLYNARYLENKLAAIVIPEGELSKKRLADELSALMLDQAKRDLLTQNSKNIGNHEAAQDIVSSVYNALKK